MIQFDEHIFQMGWFNHQLVLHVAPTVGALSHDLSRKWKIIRETNITYMIILVVEIHECHL